jgi:hypothetical protein
MQRLAASAVPEQVAPTVEVADHPAQILLGAVNPEGAHLAVAKVRQAVVLAAQRPASWLPARSAQQRASSQTEPPDAESRALALQLKVVPPMESERAWQVQLVSAQQLPPVEQQAGRLQPEQRVLRVSESVPPQGAG